MELTIEIFVIDDDENVTGAIELIFEQYGIKNFRLFNHPDQLLAALNDNVQICIVDYLLSNSQMNGLDLIKAVVKRNPHCWFIMLSGISDVKVIVQYINSVNGSRYIEKTDNVAEKLIKHIRELTNHINFIHSFYNQTKDIKEGFNDLRNLVT